MDVLNYARCFHCLKDGHWRESCPLLIPAETQAQHLNRIDAIRDRFLYEHLPPHDKQRMIETENGLWRKRKKEMASK